ncbi:MAG: hypothetical protein DWQ35_07210 [Planctomycetota bacterium]|nr:MAG: hypothetical protein DWQ35_07210 [Planctomycetota bacterium]REK24565.1 MAG: hypothetical protein DWQ42_13530 [Planctomycetota bacterium]REK49190.1 MAG: hypothetical protein DWQ46_00830 [Planctomycetota bacterium]
MGRQEKVDVIGNRRTDDGKAMGVLRATTARITGGTSKERWRRFREVYRDHLALKADTIYALPNALIDAICSEPGLESFFSPDDVRFERDLACGSGFFLGSSFSIASGIELTLKRTMIGPDLSTRLDKDRHAIEKMKQDAIMDRWGYAGWLVTDTGFRLERDAFRKRWEPTVKELGFLPSGALTRAQEGRRVREPYREFYSAYVRLLDRWGLQEMPTWDTVVPLHPYHCGPGSDLPPNITSAGFVFWEPCYRLNEDKNRLQLIAGMFLEQAVPNHLRGWLCERPRRWGPDRFARLWEIYLYFELALKTRYADRIEGNVHRLDRAMARFFCQNLVVANQDAQTTMTDSVTDARQMMNRRLST